MFDLALRNSHRLLSVVLLSSALAAAQAPSQIDDQASQAMQAQNYPEAERLYAELTRLVPNVPEVYSNLGLARYYQKKFQSGQTAFQTALHLNPNLFVPNFFLAKILVENGRYTQALPMAEKAVQTQPEDKPARRLLATVLIGLKRENRAILQYQTLLAQDPHDIDSLYDLAYVYLDRGQAAFEQIATHKETGLTYLVTGEFNAQREGFREAAVEDYRKAIAASPAIPGIRVALGNLLLPTEKWQSVEKEFREELTVDPFSYEAWLGLARVSLQAGHCDTAVHEIDEAAGIRPEFFDPLPDLTTGLSADQVRASCSAFLNSADAKQSFGAALLLWNLVEAQGSRGERASRRSQAEQKRDDLIRKYKLQAPRAPGKFPNPGERRKAGVKYLQEKRYEKGLAVLSPLLAENSEDTQVKLLVARSLFSLKRYSEVLTFLDRIRLDNPEAFYLRGASCKKLALQLMNKIVEIDPQSVRSHELIASSFVAQQMYPEAAHEYQTALTIQPNDPELYFGLGNAYFKARKFQDAEKAYSRTLNLNPLHAEAHAMRGSALLELGMPDDAVPEVRLALQLNPELVSAHAILGKALAETNQLKEAVQQLELASSTDTDGSLHYQLSSLYRRLRQPEKSRQALLASEKIRQERRQAMEESVVLQAPGSDQK